MENPSLQEPPAVISNQTEDGSIHLLVNPDQNTLTWMSDLPSEVTFKLLIRDRKGFNTQFDVTGNKCDLCSLLSKDCLIWSYIQLDVDPVINVIVVATLEKRRFRSNSIAIEVSKIVEKFEETKVKNTQAKKKTKWQERLEKFQNIKLTSFIIAMKLIKPLFKKTKKTIERMGEKMKNKNSATEIEEIELVPKCTDNGADLLIVNVEKGTKSFVLKLVLKNGEAYENISSPVVVKIGVGGNGKFTISQWSARLQLKAGHPKRGSEYRLEVYSQAKKGDPKMINSFDYTSESLAKAFGIKEAEIAPVAPIADVATASTYIVQDKMLQPLPQSKVDRLDNLLRSLAWEVQHEEKVTSKSRLRAKLGWFEDMMKDADDIETEAATLILFYTDDKSQLDMITQSCKILKPEIEKILNDTIAKLKAATEAKPAAAKPAEASASATVVPAEPPPQKAEYALTSAQIEEMVRKAREQGREETLQEIADSKTTRETQVSQAPAAKVPFLKKLRGWKPPGWFSWRILRYAIILIIVALGILWEASSGWKTSKKVGGFFASKKPVAVAAVTEATNSSDSSSGNIPVTPENDPNRLQAAGPTDPPPTVTNAIPSVKASKATIAEKGISIELGDIGKSKGGTNNQITASVVIIGNGNYYAHGTNAVSEAHQSKRVRMPDMVVDLKPEVPGGKIPCRIPPGYYAQINIPYGWKMTPNYHLPTNRKSVEECFDKYVDGKQVDPQLENEGGSEGYLNKMTQDLLIDFWPEQL